MWKNKKKGFSLIELIIAVTILAVLAAMLVPALLSSNGTARENADEADIESLATTIQMAAQTNKIYKNEATRKNLSRKVIEYQCNQIATR